MQYIASRGLIHRDLAARNILLCDNQVVKIFDFGLCCNPEQNLIYQASLPKRLPMKWLPIEALTNRIFSEKSDVWSFGILIYEVYSLGKTPYDNMDNTEVLEFLQSGRRLEKPDLANEDLFNLMMSCWEEEPLNRPTFSELSDNLRKMLEDVTEHYDYLLV
uniref:Protein kinase domain-containing protein n=1 Tax=Acrobeloides nanus TaxID=290746 RepID=A0A914CJY5_9BILA